MTRFPGETTTEPEQTLCTWLLATLRRRTRRTRTVCSEGKQQKKHSDTSSLLRKREVKFNPLGLQKKLVRQLNANKKQHILKC